MMKRCSIDTHRLKLRATIVSRVASAAKRHILAVLLTCLWVLSVPGGVAKASDSRESGFVHASWTAQNGLRGAVLAVAQTTDGFLWISGEAGLFRFDGVRLEPYTPQDGQLLNNGVLAPLFASADGGLWIGHLRGGVSFLKNGKVTNFTEREGLPTRQPRCLAQDQDGVIWAAVQDGLARFDGERWQKVGMDWNYPATTAWSVVVDHDGTVWAASADGVYALPRGEKRFRDTGLPVTPGMLLVAPDNSLWLTEPSRQTTTLLQNDSGRLTRSETTINESTWRPIFDRRGGLWMGSWGNGALYYRAPREARDATFARPGPAAEAFKEMSGLTDDHLTAFFEDREGTIWIGTNGGLDRLRRRNVSWFAMPPGAHNFSLVPGQPGEILVASGYTDTFTLPQRAAAMNSPKNVQFAYRDPDGTVWFNSYDGVDSRYHATLYQRNGSQLTKVAMPAGVEFLNVRAMVKDTTGSFWVSANLRGVYRLHEGVWSHVEVFKDAPRALASAAITDSMGRVWLSYPTRKQIALIAGGTVQKTFGESDLPIGAVSLLARSNDYVWVAGDDGIAFANHDRFHRVVGDDGSTFAQVESIVATASDGIWLSAQQGIVHIPHDEVGRVVADPAHKVRYVAYDETTDLPDRLQTMQFGNADSVQDSDGVLWFATRSGVARIDPRTISKNVVPPPVVIRSVSGDGQDYAVDTTDITLPALTKEVRVVYTALSMALPERVRFRYRLDGWDQDWHDAGPRREVFYTNLAPGQYRFRVTAANNDGVWNDVGASLAFSVAPAWYQTNWFTAAWLLTAALGVVSAYRLRVRQVARALNVRHEERLAERTRIAQDLHDTLLQGALAASMHVQVANEVLDEAHPSAFVEELQSPLRRATQLLHQLANDGRAALSDLRFEPKAGDLTDLLHQAAKDQPNEVEIEFRLTVDGTARPLKPSVFNEVGRIAREAIVNAFKHSRARLIEVELVYTPAEFRCIVRDDGQGIQQPVIERGREGHWGLPGMRERSERIGGELHLRSSATAGTEVVMSIAGELAYTVDETRKNSLRWFR